MESELISEIDAIEENGQAFLATPSVKNGHEEIKVENEVSTEIHDVTGSSKGEDHVESISINQNAPESEDQEECKLKGKYEEKPSEVKDEGSNSESTNGENESYTIINDIKLGDLQSINDEVQDLSTEPRISFEDKNEDVYDVIVVGAGIAGSSAAYYLKKNCPSLKIIVVEAKDRVGGRTQTLELKCSEDGLTKSEWDVGGQWVTDSQTNITKLINELGIETYRQFDTGKKVLETNRKIVTYNSSIPKISLMSLVDLQLMMMKISSSCKKVSTLNPFENQAFAQSLDLINLESMLGSKSFTSTSRSIIDPTIRTIFGTELSQINGLFGSMYVKSGGGSVEKLALTEKGCAQEKRVKGGTMQISEKLLKAAGLYDTLLLNRALVQINQLNGESGPVEIVVKNTVDGSVSVLKSKKVVSSIPLNQYAFVEFKPELPWYKRNVYQHCQMGNLIKFIVTYSAPFWRSKGFSGEVVSDGSYIWLDSHKLKEFDKDASNWSIPSIGPINCVFDGTNSSGYPALVGFIGGRCGVEWIDVDPELRKQEVIEALVRYFGEEARLYADYYEKEWAKEKFSGGCPTCNLSSSGIMKDYVRATRESFISVHFCGTESATVWQGYMDGAAESGERAANEVLYKLFKVSDSSIKIDFEKTFYHQKNYLKK